jgi:hypothetical protein
MTLQAPNCVFTTFFEAFLYPNFIIEKIRSINSSLTETFSIIQMRCKAALCRFAFLAGFGIFAASLVQPATV